MIYKTPALKSENNIVNPLEKGGVNSKSNPALPRKPDFPVIGTDDLTSSTSELIDNVRKVREKPAEEIIQKKKNLISFNASVLGVNEAFSIGDGKPYYLPIQKPEDYETVTATGYGGFVMAAQGQTDYLSFFGGIDALWEFMKLVYVDTSPAGRVLAAVLDVNDAQAARTAANTILNNEDWGVHLILPLSQQYTINKARFWEITVPGGLVTYRTGHEKEITVGDYNYVISVKTPLNLLINGTAVSECPPSNFCYSVIKDEYGSYWVCNYSKYPYTFELDYSKVLYNNYWRY